MELIARWARWALLPQQAYLISLTGLQNCWQLHIAATLAFPFFSLGNPRFISTILCNNIVLSLPLKCEDHLTFYRGFRGSLEGYQPCKYYIIISIIILLHKLYSPTCESSKLYCMKNRSRVILVSSRATLDDIPSILNDRPGPKPIESKHLLCSVYPQSCLYGIPDNQDFPLGRTHRA